MRSNFRAIFAKDIETPEETLVFQGFTNMMPKSNMSSRKISITEQQKYVEALDEDYEKRKRDNKKIN